jgi:hypothetical protein
LGVVLIALAYAGLSQRGTYQAAYHDYATAKAKTEARQEISERCGVLPTVKEALGCAKQAVETARDPERAEDDLKAQQEMAAWAYWSLWISGLTGFITIGVGVIGIVFVRRTLVAALHANEIARDTGQAQVRAYLSCLDATFEINLSSFQLRPRIANKGQSPANNISIDASVQTQSPEGIGFLWSKTTIGHCEFISADREGTGFVLWLHGDFKSDVFDKLLNPEGRAYQFSIKGRIEWDDVFEQRYCTDFFLDKDELVFDNRQYDSRMGVLRAFNQRTYKKPDQNQK